MQPLVSICIPTYKRPVLLARAVASAVAQTYQNIEIVISDDEGPDSPSWTAVRAAFPNESRIRFCANPGPRGQAGNTNHAMANARGDWIKPLHDDDVLRPSCIEVFLASVARMPHAVAASCRSDHYVDGTLRRAFVQGARPYLESLRDDQRTLAMYIMKDVGGSLPTEQFVHRRVIESGIVLADEDRFKVLVDSCWNARVRAFGPTLIVNDALVEWHQGRHETVTSTSAKDSLDAEFINFRSYVKNYVPASTTAPPLAAVEDFVRLQRSLARLARHDIFAALRLAARVRRPSALLNLARHMRGKTTFGIEIARIAVASHRPELAPAE